MKKYVSLIALLLFVSINKVSAKSYDLGDIIYFNPTTGYLCNEEDSVSTTGTKSGCMKWYIVEASSDANPQISVILDHNITTNTEVDLSADHSYLKEDHEYEATSVKTAMQTNTNGWKNVSNIRSLNVNKLIKDITGNDFNYSYTITYTTENGHGSFTSPAIFYFYQDGFPGVSKEYVTYSHNLQTTTYLKNSKKFAWLFDYTNNCKNNGCNVEDSRTNGYWTANAGISYRSSGYSPNDPTTGNPSASIEADFTTYAIKNTGTIEDSYNDNVGLRPVVTINKKDLVFEPEKNEAVNENNISIENKEKGISIVISKEEKNVTENSVVDIKEITSGDIYTSSRKKVEKQLSNKINNFSLIDLSVYKDSTKTEEIEPSGKVTIKLKIPNKFISGEIKVYRINKDKAELIKSKVENGYIVFETDKFDLYALVEEKIENPKTNINVSIIMGIIILLSVSSIYTILSKKKKLV